MDTKKILTRAIDLAEEALNAGNYPCGALLCDNQGNIIAEGRNESYTAHDITAHAEIRCLQSLSIHDLLNPDNTYHLFTSTEPCGACSFFIARAKAIKSITWGLTDPQTIGFYDLAVEKPTKSLFSNMHITEEPIPELRQVSAQLFKDFYKKSGQTAKADLYEE